MGSPSGTRDSDTSLDLEQRAALGRVLSRLTGHAERTRIGRYEVRDKLGAGACGAVYAAYDPKLDRTVAIKVVLPRSHGPATSVEQERLLREAHALAKLRHPNVVEVFDVGVEPHAKRPSVYVVMELVQGRTLAEWIEQDRPSPDAVVDAYRQAARGLAAAHEAGVVHRDFKPANAMVTVGGRVKVLDFGLARDELYAGTTAPTPELDVSQSGDHVVSGSLTRTGVVMGTPRYMAPEQHVAEVATPASDQYALCVSLWESLVGRPPFEGADIRELAAAKFAGSPARHPALPRRVYDVLVRGLSREPERRYLDLAALADALSPPTRTRWPWIAAAAGVATLAAVGLSHPGEPAASAPTRDPICAQASAVGDWSSRFAAIVSAHTPARESNAWGIQDRIRLRLDRFAREWDGTRAEICDPGVSLPEAPRVHAQCLERAADRFGEVLDGLQAEGDDRHDVRELLALAVPSRCTSDTPQELFTSNLSPQMHAYAQLAETLILEHREHPEGLAELEAAMVQARAQDQPWVITQLQAAAMQYDGAAGRSAEASRRGEETVWVAESSGDTLLALEGLSSMIAHAMDANVGADELERMFAHGDRLLEAAGHPAAEAVKLYSLHALAVVGPNAEVRVDELSARARALSTPTPPPGAERLLALGLISAASLKSTYAPQLAIEETERALALANERGAWYPAVAATAHGSMALAAGRRDDDDGVAHHQLEKVRWLARQLEPDHPQTRYAVAAYGRTLATRGAEVEGIAHMQTQYFAILDDHEGTDHKLAFIAYDLAEAYLRYGHPRTSLQWAQRELEHDQSQYGIDSHKNAWAHLMIARAQLRLDQLHEAKTHIDRAFEIFDRNDTRLMPFVHLVRAEHAALRGRHDDAQTDILAGLQLLGAHLQDSYSTGTRAELYGLLVETMRARGNPDAERLAPFADEAMAHANHFFRVTPPLLPPPRPA